MTENALNDKLMELAPIKEIDHIQNWLLCAH